jgi:hypothetical protein
MDKNAKDRGSSLFWMVVALGICFGSLRLGLGVLHRPGPGFFSFLAGSVLCILSLSVFFRSRKARGSSGKGKEAFLPGLHGTLKMAYVTIALILYAIGMNYVGFFFATILFLGFLLRGIDPQPWWVVVIISILGAITCSVVFQYWLGVQLPCGPFGI